VRQPTYDPSVEEARLPTLAVVGGVGVALSAVLLAATGDGPYLSTGSVSGWMVVFAVGLFTALFATPFALERGMRPTVEDRDKRWERALLAWGAISVAVLGAGILFGIAGDFSGERLAGAVGLVVTTEAVLVLGTMVFWLLSG